MGIASQFRPKLLFVVTEDWYFVSHRLALAVAARAAGYDVAVATRVDRHGEAIRTAGLRLFNIQFNRSGMRPIEELATIRSLLSVYRREKPDIVHHVAMKPVVYGSLAARVARVPAVVNALGGLGFVFSSDTLRARLIRSVARPALKVALSGKDMRLILQNVHDKRTLCNAGLVDPAKIEIIRGAGVDPAHYATTDPKISPPLVTLPARLLKEKGVAEFVQAARLLRERGIAARFALVGRPDTSNPSSFSQETVDGWVSDSVVEAWGWREDMRDVYAQTQIVCLPSYHEGFPKVLLEAAASKCAIVASDIPGCRELVRHGETGLLVPPKDPASLADALQDLIGKPERRAQLGTAARSLVMNEFSLSHVVSQTKSVYESLLKAVGGGQSK